MKRIITLFLLLFCVSNFHAQVSSYTFSEASEAYNQIAGTNVLATPWDEDVTTNTIPIGFTFRFNGVNYNTCSVNANGFLTFGGVTSANNVYAPISNNTAYAGAICAIGFDQEHQGFAITRTTTGVAPNRIFTVQWRNASRYTFGELLNYQIILHETSNIIKIKYGSFSNIPNNPNSVQVGLRGASNADFNNRSLVIDATWDGITTAGAANNAACRLNIGGVQPNNGRTFIWTPAAPPTITSFSNTNGCGGSTLTINGTNLSGATAVTIGGTAAAITANTPTSVTVTVGAGTTGTVQVTTAGGTGTSATTFTVLPTPVAIGGGATTVCTGGTTPAFTNATAGGTWSITNGTGTASISAGGVVTGVTTGTVTVVYTIGTCSVTKAITVITTPTITTNPINASVATGDNVSFSVVATNTPTSYTWQVSTNGGGTWTTVTNGGVYSNATTATLTITGVTAGMNGYLYRASATNSCGTSAYSTNATLSINAVLLVSGLGVNNVNCGQNVTLRDQNDLGNYNAPRTDWTVINVTGTATVTITGTYNVFEPLRIYEGVGNSGVILQTYWNNNGNVNFTSQPGQTVTIYFAPDLMDDYAAGFQLNVTYSGTCAASCSTPTVQPTVLALTSTGTSISGGFTHASPVPDKYLVVRSNNATAPVPVNGNYYSIGSAMGAGKVVVSSSSSNNFSATGLTPSTTYHFFVFSYNICSTGGPRYLTTTPLYGNKATTASKPCIPPATDPYHNEYIAKVQTSGCITNINNATGESIGGFADYSASTPVTQIQGGGVAFNIYSNNLSQYIHQWVDWNKDGDFDDANELIYDGVVSGNLYAGPMFATGFIIPAATPVGDYRVRIRMTLAADFSAPYITPCGFGNRGETEDYTLRVVADCVAKVSNIQNGSRCGTGTVVLGAQRAVAGVTQFRFYDAEFGGNLIGTQAVGGAGMINWTTPSISTTTNYYVAAWNGSCESWYRTKLVATVNSEANITLTPSVTEVCGENSVVRIDAAGDIITETIFNETFEGGAFGVFTTGSGGYTDADLQWTNRTGPYLTTSPLWRPVITSNAVGNRFALSNFNFMSWGPNWYSAQSLFSPVFSAATYTNLYLSFKEYMEVPFVNDGVVWSQVQLSTDGGATYPIILFDHNERKSYGLPGDFSDNLIDLSAYAGQTNLRLRFILRKDAGHWGGWALDDIHVYGTKPVNTTFTWPAGGYDAYTNAACTIAYTNQSVTSIWIKPTLAQLSAASWNIEATATLGNGCPITKTLVMPNKTKVWKGTVSNDWNNAANWSSGVVPDINTCIVIPNATNSSVLNTGAAGLGKNLVVKNTGTLDIQGVNSLTIKETVNVESGGTFNVRNNASLVQIDNVANTAVGTFSYRRTATGIKGSDYIYWSSPVSGQNLSSIYSTPTPGDTYQWNTTAANANGGLGTWGAVAGAMTTARGYIMRGSSNFNMAATTINANFTGVPNNGDITIKATRGAMQPTNVGAGLAYNTTLHSMLNAFDDNWSLLGNPYPSAINALQFLSTNSANLMGTVRLWRHLSAPAAIPSPFYQNFVNNYNSNDYLTINFTGPTTPGASDIIKTGQAFMVQRREGAQDLTGVDVIFINALRRDGTTILSNSTFFRNNTNSIEKNRIWIDIVDNATQSSETTLIGYVDGATNDWDDNYDATVGLTPNVGIYTFVDVQKCIIQGKALPFNTADIIPLGINVQNNGNYFIAINTVDGLFSDATQNIYLEDKQLNSIHDLRNAPYSFTSNAGTFNDRFVLRFTNTALSTNDFDLTNSVKIFTNESINIISDNETIKEVIVYDILGKTLATETGVNKNEISLTSINKTQSTLLVKVTLTNGKTHTKKVIY